MAISISQIAANILPDVSGSLNVQRELSVVQSLQEFARRSNVFDFTEEHSVTPDYVVDFDNNSIGLRLASKFQGYQPWRLESLFINGAEKMTALGNTITTITNFGSIYRSGIVYYKFESSGELTIFPFPQDTAFGSETGIMSIVVRCIYIPDTTITEIDDFFYLRWGKAIEAGAKALLMIQPGNPWSNPGLASVLMQQFDGARNAALMKRNIEESGGELRVEKIPFV